MRRTNEKACILQCRLCVAGVWFVCGLLGLHQRDDVIGGLIGRHAAGTVETVLPIGDVHVLHADRGAAARCMDELAVTQVDAHMAEGTAHGIEEHQIAGAQVFFVDHFGGVGLLLGNARQHQPLGLLENGAHEAAAIEAGFRAAATASIGDSNEAHGGGDECTRTIRHAVTNVLKLRNQATFGQKVLHIVSRGVGGRGDRNIRER
ncbi:hypothetical protein SDC9_95931 [bioreactor metagenome]|uniref:Uncharacterized protein n=1 Tax=bioreactor metagenome TaxID=1076179 RepID=A0A645AED4_9ZZZZ